MHIIPRFDERFRKCLLDPLQVALDSHGERSFSHKVGSQGAFPFTCDTTRLCTSSSYPPLAFETLLTKIPWYLLLVFETSFSQMIATAISPVQMYQAMLYSP